MQINPRFEVSLRLALFVDALVARPDAEHNILFVVKKICTWKFGKDIDACFLTFFSQPSCKPVQRNNVITMVLQWRRSNRRSNRKFFRQIKEIVFLDRGFKRSTLLDKTRN